MKIDKLMDFGIRWDLKEKSLDLFLFKNRQLSYTWYDWTVKFIKGREFHKVFGVATFIFQVNWDASNLAENALCTVFELFII